MIEHESHTFAGGAAIRIGLADDDRIVVFAKLEGNDLEIAAKSVVLKVVK